jgi:hypothetical protein
MYYEWIARADSSNLQDAAGLAQQGMPCLPLFSDQQELQPQQQQPQQQSEAHDQPDLLQHDHQQDHQQTQQQQQDVQEVEQFPAVHIRLQPTDQQEQLHKQQLQKHKQHHAQQQDQQQQQQQQQQSCKPAGDRGLLSRLLGPAGGPVPQAAAAAAAAGGRLSHRQQQQLVIPEQPLQPPRGQPLLLSPTAPGHSKPTAGQREQHAQQRLAGQQQQQPLHQQQGRKRRHDPQQLQQQLLQQQEQQQQRQQLSHEQLDAQSQAPAAGNILMLQQLPAAAASGDSALAGIPASEGSGGQLNPAGNSSRPTTWLPPAPAGQQLFSPRTATHAPRFCEASCPAGDIWQQQQWESPPQQQQQHEDVGDVIQPTPSQLPQQYVPDNLAAVADDDAVPPAAAAVVQQSLDEAPFGNAGSPVYCSTWPQQQQQQQSTDVPAVVSAEAEVVAATPLADSKSIGQQLAATPHSAVQLGSVIAESPAVPDSTCADESAKPQHQQQLQQLSKQLFAVDVCDDSPRTAAAAAVQQQQQQPHGEGLGGRTCINSSSRSSSNTLWLGRHGQQQRVHSLHVGQPIVSMASCQGQCIVAMQHSSCRYELLQLSVQAQATHTNLQQQQQHAHDAAGAEVCIELQGLAALIAPGPPAAAAAVAPDIAAAMKVLPSKPWPSQIRPTQQQQQQQQQPHQGQQQHLSSILLAVAVPLEIHDIDSSNRQPTPKPAGVGAAAVAAAVAADRARSESPAAAVVGTSTTPGLPTSAGREGTPGASAVGGRTLKSLTHSVSTGKRKALTAGSAAAGAAASEAGAKHGVSIYSLRPAPAAAKLSMPGQEQHSKPLQQQQQQRAASTVLVQSLHTSHAVSCLAVSEEAGCLAAAGSAGFACVWPLINQQQQQQDDPGAKHLPRAAAAAPAGNLQQQQQVVDAGGVVVLPSASYRSFLFPSINQLCFVLQPGRQGLLVYFSSQIPGGAARL